jgi:cytochrome P450
MELSAAAPRPAHVTDAVFYDFDLFADPALLKDPHARILDLHRNAPPVFWTPRNGGHWMLLSHQANFEASKDTETFSSEMMPQELIEQILASLPPDMPRYPQPLPISLDPPKHGIYRMPLQKAFSPKAMNELKGKIRSLAAELIDKIKPLGAAEFMSTVAEPMPVQVFLEMFGLPVSRQAEYRALVKEWMEGLKETDTSKAPERMQRVAKVMRDTLIERRDNPQDDLISLLWQSKIGDRETTLNDLEDYSVLLFIAGLDTVMNGIGHGVIHLARNPELQRKLRANPELIPDAAEELLRRYTFTVPPRRVAKDTTFLGAEMKAEERALLFLPGADLDAREFKDPEQYNLVREGEVHIAFGVGPHRCLGSHLARYELVILYEELLKRLPEFSLDASKPLHYHGGHVIGPDEVWLKWSV